MSNDKEELSQVVTSYGLNVDEQGYTCVGEYKIIFSCGDNEVFVNVDVVDTIAPVFEEIWDLYEVKKGEVFDCSLIKASDLSEVNIWIDDTEVDHNRKGEYKAIAHAKDQYGNVTEKEIIIKVV